MENQRIRGFKSLLILCICVFCVYEVQEVALNKMDNYARQHLGPPPLPALSSLEILSQNDVAVEEHQKGNTTQVWITMALCWSANAQVHGKENFPYKDALPLSSQLWMKMTPAKVVVQIVYSEPQVSQELLDYKSELESHGTVVFLVPTGSEIKCVLKSQLVRVLVFLLPMIQPDDIIVTADVDAFVMTPDIYKPLQLRRQVWLYRYAFTLGSGSTFMMPFIGARSSAWRSMLQYDSSQDSPINGLLGNGLPKMIEEYGAKMSFGLNSSYTWDIDQHIVSYGILNSGLCSLPKENGLWKELHTEPRVFNDGKTCWHGSGIYEDCNNVLWSRNLMIRYKGGNCKWWHFYPYETYAELRSKFQEIMAGESESPLLSNLMSAAKTFQTNTFGQEII